MIKRRVVSPNNEYLLLSNMIMDNEVISAAYNRYKSGELKTNHITSGFRPVFRWLIQYYGNHRKAPKRTIQKIFDIRGKSLNKDSKELVGEYLDRLAEEYSEYEEDADPEYVRFEILPNFIRERELTFRLEKAQDNLEQGKIEDAEKLVTAYAKIEKEETDKNIGTIIPYTKEDLEQNYNTSLGEPIFRFDGDLGRLIRPLCKSWLVAIMGVEKSGKSYLLQEMAYQAALYQRKKVLIINLELNQNLARNRLWRRISKTANKEDAGHMVYPILDCENNQNRTCKILKRYPNKKALFKVPDETVLFARNKKWKVCQKCKDGKNTKWNTAKTKRFVPAVWFEKTERKIREINEMRVQRSLNRRRFNNLKNLRIKCFPRFSVTFDEVYDYILRYMDKTKWVPNFIVFDYLDILAPEASNLQERIDIDRKWKKASKMAGELNCLVATADQANKAGRVAYMLDQMSTTESKTKDSHLDVRIAINQRSIDKAIAIARLNVLFHRHAGFSVEKEVVTTQRLETAEPLMDCASIFRRMERIPVAIHKI